MRKVTFRGQETAWLPSTFSASSEIVSPKLSLCQNAVSDISEPRKFLATFKLSRQNKPLVPCQDNANGGKMSWGLSLTLWVSLSAICIVYLGAI